MATPYTSYRDWLRDELAARVSRNRLYSLRAFARDLDLRPSHLSDVLHGKLGLSAKSAEQIGRVMGLSPEEKNHFVVLVEAEHSRSAERREKAKKQLAQSRSSGEYRTLDEDVFEIISDWHHYAILELVLTEDFVPRLSWIAERLGISRVEVESAVRRLKAVGLLIVKGSKWTVTEKFPATKSGIPSSAIKKFHSQILSKATDALTLQTVEQRDFSAMTFPINPDDLNEIKEELKVFRRALEKKYKARSHRREVYALSIQFFSLSQRKRSNLSLRSEVAHA